MTLQDASGNENLPSARSAPQDQSMVAMSVVEDGQRISFSAYNEDTNTITLEECHANGHEVQSVIERVLAVIRPSLLLVPSKVVASGNLIEILTKTPPTPPRPADTTGEPEEDQDPQSLQRAPSTSLTGMVTIDSSRNKRPGSLIPYQVLKSSSFDVRNCKAMILRKLRVRSLMNGTARVNATTPDGVNDGRLQRTAEEQRHFPLATGCAQSIPVSVYHALATMIDFESKAQIQAVGSLLSFLNNTIFRLNNDETSGDAHIVVSDIVRANSSMFMTISAETLASLNVFSTEYHPLAIAKGTGNAKEGSSLFSLLDRTKSRSGRERLKEWMLKPLVDLNAIQRRQNGVDLFLLQDMAEARSTIVQVLANVAAVDKILQRIHKCCAKPQDFLGLFHSLEAVTQIVHVLQHQVLFALQQLLAAVHQAPENQPCPDSISSEYQILSSMDFVESLLENCNTELAQDLADRLKAAIDLEATADWHTVLIRRGYDQELDCWKEQYSRLSRTLRAVGEEHGQQFPHLRDFMDIIFIPQVGNHRLVLHA